MDGILCVNKPSGKTSFSIVSMVRRLSGERRVGHAGTLDPAASGVLPVCLGQATRVIEYLQEAPKSYRADILLGVTTDTYDTTGRIISRSDPSGVSEKQLVSALDSFRGLISQTPPMYSAVKHSGRPLYQLARLGIVVERKSRRQQVYRLELVDWQPPVATVEVECSKGTYIRSLAYDLGQLLGCGASLAGLTRTGYGPFKIGDAVSASQLEDAFTRGYWPNLVYPLDCVLLPWAAVVVGEATERKIREGCPLVLPRGKSRRPTGHLSCRAYNQGGCFFGILRYDQEKDEWWPDKVLAGLDSLRIIGV